MVRWLMVLGGDGLFYGEGGVEDQGKPGDLVYVDVLCKFVRTDMRLICAVDK